jgi:hypothetical protein
VLNEWLSDPQKLAAAREEVSQLADRIVEAGGVRNAAVTLLKRLDRLPETPAVIRGAA